jgi:phosphoribosylformimino-5-aminoimidazole carboxamide ribotide isomerase
MTFTVYPAIDVRAGRVVRLRQGDYAQETRYGDEPVAWFRQFAADGATWVHLVDLDAARDGGYTLSSLVGDIKRETRLRVQTGGGIRDTTDVERLLDAGADRVVVGSTAINEPDRVAPWLARFGGECLTVALDARRNEDGEWFPATHGWTRPAERSLEWLVRFYAGHGLRHLLCTDIASDGMLSGPNLALYRQVLEWAPGVRLQASGGASEVDDVARVRALGCSGIVLGRALLEGRIRLPEALAC